MSSYIIEKEEYIKAAGLIVGIIAAKMPARVKDLTPRIKEGMEKVYFCNVKSVCADYPDDGDMLSYIDDNSYDNIFEEYIDKGKRIALSPELNNIRVSLFQFFSSVSYQINDKECNHTAKDIMYSCLSDACMENDCWWGQINL